MRGAIAGLGIATLLFGAVASAAKPRVAIVDLDRAARETEEGLRLVAGVRKARAVLESRCLDELATASEFTMPVSCALLTSRDEREEVALAVAGVRAKLVATVATLAKQHGLDLVIERGSIVVHDALDLSEQLVDAYNRGPQSSLHRFAVVDTARCMRESEEGLRETARARKLWSAYVKACSAAPSINDPSCRIVASFADEDDFVADALFPLRERVRFAIERLSKKQGIELVVEEREAVMTNAVDMTDAVIDALNGAKSLQLAE